MKYRFEDTSIAIGYIKELLHNFNLPSVDVYNEKTSTKYNGKVYIKDNKVVKYINDDGIHTQTGSSPIYDAFIDVGSYTYNRPVINFTRNLDINSNVYDKETHEYLGDYLRFLRDYHNLNLMGLYNCFDYREPAKIVHTTKISFKQGEKVTTYNFTVDTYDSRYNYYIVPVKFNKNYTVAIDANTPFEMCCIIDSNSYLEQTFGDFTDEDDIDKLIRITYTKVPGSSYSKPFIFKAGAHKEKDEDDFKKIVEDHYESSQPSAKLIKGFIHRERDFKLLLKIPKSVNSTITILEGDFTNCQVFDGMLVENVLHDINQNRELATSYDTFPTRLSLLKVNNKKSYPFADRLIEYLVGNVISNVDDVPNNVERVQDIIYSKESLDGWYGVWDDNLRKRIHDIAKLKDKTKGLNKRKSNHINELVYSYDEGQEKWIKEKVINVKPLIKKFNDLYDDVLYYVDKDIETMLNLEEEDDNG